MLQNRHSLTFYGGLPFFFSLCFIHFFSIFSAFVSIFCSFSLFFWVTSLFVFTYFFCIFHVSGTFLMMSLMELKKIKQNFSWKS